MVSIANKEKSLETIKLTDSILKKIKDLPIEKQQAILDFAEFISHKYVQEKEKENNPKKKRVAGLSKGKIWMSEDFNDPLSV